MAAGNIPNYTSFIHVITTPTVNQLKNAKAVVIHYRVTDNSSASTLALISNSTTVALTAAWNGAAFYYTTASFKWSKTDGTITMTAIYSQRPSATVQIMAYDLFM